MTGHAHPYFSIVAELGDIPRPSDNLVELARRLAEMLNVTSEHVLKATSEDSPFLDYALINVQAPNVTHTFILKYLERREGDRDESLVAVSNMENTFNFFKAADEDSMTQICRHINDELAEKLRFQADIKARRTQGLIIN